METKFNVLLDKINNRRCNGAEAIERVLKKCDTEDHKLMDSFGDAYARHHEEIKDNCVALIDVIFGI